MFTPETTIAARSGRAARRRRGPARAWRRACRISIVGDESRRASLPAETALAWRDALAVLVAQPIAPGTAVETVVPAVGGDVIRVRGTVEYARKAPAGSYEVGVRLDGWMPGAPGGLVCGARDPG